MWYVVHRVEYVYICIVHALNDGSLCKHFCDRRHNSDACLGGRTVSQHLNFQALAQ